MAKMVRWQGERLNVLITVLWKKSPSNKNNFSVENFSFGFQLALSQNLFHLIAVKSLKLNDIDGDETILQVIYG